MEILWQTATSVAQLEIRQPMENCGPWLSLLQSQQTYKNIVEFDITMD